MKFRRVLASLVLALSLPAGIAAAASPAPPAGPTARDFAREPAIQGLSISPSGKNLVGIVSPNGDTRYIAIKDMGHQFNLMTPAHFETQLVEIEKHLTTECGPGGL